MENAVLMPLREPAIEAAVRRALGAALRVAVARQPLAPADLSSGERSTLHGFTSTARRREWLTGRAALKRLLARLGADGDTSRIVFPHAQLALTHSRGVAIAVAAPDPRGVGVDLELRRGIEPQAARFFLAGGESALAARADGASRILLRLWTAKEALFKADGDNAHRTLRDYRFDDPAGSGGGARRAGRREARFRYSSFRVAGGYLSVAVRADEAQP